MPGADAMPPKVRAALIGGLLLVLGFASAAYLFASPPPPEVVVSVPEARALAVWCGGSTHRADADTPTQLVFAPTSHTCEVVAFTSSTRRLRGVLQLGPQRAYRCVRDGNGLLCGVDPS